MALFKTPEYTLIGSKALEEAKPYLKKCGKKALIVTGKHVVLSDMMAELKKALEEIGIAYFVFDGITGEPTNVMIDKGIAAYKENGCDFCIGIGGGSPLDSAKAIAAMITNEGKIADYNGKVIEKPIPPVVAIPTTAGTGSEATQFTVITDVEKDIKMLLKGGYLVPKIAIVDPAYTYSAPKSITAATGMDAITHAVESYISNMATPLTEYNSLKGLEILYRNLPAAVENGNDMEAREQMMLGCIITGFAFSNANLGLVHGIAHTLSAHFGLAHGMANATVLPYVMRYNAESCPEKMAALAEAIGIDLSGEQEKDQYLLSDALLKLTRRLGIKTLSEQGIDEKDLDMVAEDVLKEPVLGFNPRQGVTKEAVLDILKQAY